jgi:hypothetical protein
MLFFPLWKNANGEVMFFQPVFNIADSAITMGVISILLFQRSYFNGNEENTLSNSESEHQVIAQENENSSLDFQQENDVSASVEGENTEGVIEKIEGQIKDKENSQDTPS